MVAEKEIYVSFENFPYKRNKASLLECQKNLINIQKSFHHLSAIRETKKRYVEELHRLFQIASLNVEKVDRKMPQGSMPKQVRENIVKKAPTSSVLKVKQVKEKNDFSLKINDLDSELLEINRKLKELGN